VVAYRFAVEAATAGAPQSTEANAESWKAWPWVQRWLFGLWPKKVWRRRGTPIWL